MFYEKLYNSVIEFILIVSSSTIDTFYQNLVPILVPKFGVNLVPILVKNVNLVAILVKNVNLVAILVKSVNLVKNVNGR